MKWVDHEYYILKRIFCQLGRGTEDAINRSLANHRRKCYWRRWFAWRPVHIPEMKADHITVRAHYVWLEFVDCRRTWFFFREYRPNILAYDQYERYDEYKNEKVYKTWDQFVQEAADGQ